MSQIRTLVVTATRSGGISTVIVNRVSSANFASTIHGATSKATPVDADEIPLADSAASWVLKKLTWANLKATVKTYFDTLYATAVQGALADSALQSVPTASDTVLGGVKVGSGLTITAGVLSVSGSSYTLPIATGSVLGGIKSSTDILVDAGTGVATVNTSTGGNASADFGKVVKFGASGEVMRLTMNEATGDEITAGSINTSAATNYSGGSINTSATATLTELPFTTGRSGGSIDTTAGGSLTMGTGSLTGPATSGTIAITSQLSAYQTTAGTLALGGFSSITGTLAIANVAAETATRLATAFNAGTEDTAAADSDRIAVTSPAGGWMSLTTLWTWITGKLNTRYSQLENYFSFLTASGPSCTNSTTLVGSGCTVTLPVGNYILSAEIYVDASTSNNGGNKVQLVKTGSGTAAGNAQVGIFSTTNGTGLDARGAFDTSITYATNVPAVVAYVHGHLFVTGNSVTLEWQCALNSTDAAVPVRTPIRGTYIKATRIS